MWGHDWDEWVVMPLGQRDHYQHQYRQEDEEFQRGSELSYHLNAAHVDIGDYGNHGQGNDPVSPPGEFRKIESKVVGELHCVNAAQQEGRRPVPPSGEKSPEIAETGAHPAVEAAFDRHGGGQLGGDQGDWDTPEEWDHQEVDQSHARAGGGDHVLETEGASGAVGKHHPDEIEENGFAQGGLGGGGHAVGLYGEGRLQI
jgi:hypothetical protein